MTNGAAAIKRSIEVNGLGRVDEAARTAAHHSIEIRNQARPSTLKSYHRSNSMKRLLLGLACAASIFAQSLGSFVQGGQQAVTGSAVQLPNFVANAICLSVAPGGTQTVYIGGAAVSTSTGFPLAAGGGTCFPIANLNQLYVVATTTGSTVAWYGVKN